MIWTGLPVCGQCLTDVCPGGAGALWFRSEIAAKPFEDQESRRHYTAGPDQAILLT